MELEEYRKQIDQLDAQMIPLLEQRMNLVRQVAQYKKERRLPILQAGREQAVLQKAVARLENPAYAQAAVRFMNGVMEISRDAQRQEIQEEATKKATLPLGGMVGFYGAAGSFSEQALVEYFGSQHHRQAYGEFEEVFLALQQGEIAYGVLPIENSSTGAIAAVYDLLGRYGFFIVGEHRLRIRQNLIGVENTTLDTIRQVYSHAQGIEQSGGFLSGHKDWEMIPFHSTAYSAAYVAEAKDPTKAAIASLRAAELYGLQVIAPDIQDNQNNATRFIVIGRTLQPEHAEKVSLVFSLDHASGALFNTLREFAQQGINLVKLESRPIPDVPWNYRFYLDFEGDFGSGAVQEVLTRLMQETREYRLLGAYALCRQL